MYQNESQKLQKSILNRLQRTEVLTRLLMFEKLIDNLLDTIAASKIGITHPSLLTKDELVMTDMNFSKLKNIKTGVMKYTNGAIIIALKIPEEIITLPIKIILPVTNQEKEEIDLEPFFVIAYKSKEYIFNNEKNNVNDLRERNDCIIKKNCLMKINKNFEIINLNQRTFIVKNADNTTVQNNCDGRELTLTGNYIINIHNCNIKINDAILKNKETNYTFQLYYEEIIKENVTMNTIFKKIEKWQEIDNRHTIELLKYNKIKTYVISGTSMFIVIMAIICIAYIVCKKVGGTGKIKIKIQNTTNKKSEKLNDQSNFQEKIESKEGGVKYWS